MKLRELDDADEREGLRDLLQYLLLIMVEEGWTPGQIQAFTNAVLNSIEDSNSAFV